jgi:acyl-CoA synthetase (AMP-forming)/AMP-acid ligase II
LELLQKCQSNYILTGSQQTQFTVDIVKHAHRNDHPVNVLPITVMKPAPVNVAALNIQINPEAVIKPSRPSMVTFSTGSSDTPKAIVQTRRYFYRPINTPVHATLLMAVDQNHMISTMNAICVPIFGGCKGEIIDPSSSSNSAALFWNRLRKGGVTSLSGMPQFWDSMARYYQNHLSKLPAEEREEYLKWARFLRMAYVMGMVAPAQLLRFWREELKRPLQVAYGGTEFGGLAATTTAEGGYINNVCLAFSLNGYTQIC